jgi:predicted kinase
MGNAILTVGLPGCGKSTWADHHADGYRIVERDIIRSRLCEELGIEFSWATWDTRLEDRVTQLWGADIAQAIMGGADVCCSDTNLNPKYRKQLAERLLGAGYSVTYVLFDTHVQVCKARNALRGKRAVNEVAYEHLMPFFLDARNSLEQECSMLGATLIRLTDR